MSITQTQKTADLGQGWVVTLYNEGRRESMIFINKNSTALMGEMHRLEHDSVQTLRKIFNSAGKEG